MDKRKVKYSTWEFVKDTKPKLTQCGHRYLHEQIYEIKSNERNFRRFLNLIHYMDHGKRHKISEILYIEYGQKQKSYFVLGRALFLKDGNVYKGHADDKFSRDTSEEGKLIFKLGEGKRAFPFGCSGDCEHDEHEE